MACGSEGLTIERVWDSSTGAVIFKLPSGYPDKVLMVYEDPFDVSVTVVTEKEYRRQVDMILTAGCEPQERLGNDQRSIG